LGLQKGTLKVGADADVTIIDPDVEWEIDPNQFQSKSRNTPFAGRQVKGRAEKVLLCGDVRYNFCKAPTYSLRSTNG
jgi:dihydroorotase